MSESIAIIILRSEKDKAEFWDLFRGVVTATSPSPVVAPTPVKKAGPPSGDQHYSRYKPERLARGGKNGKVKASRFSAKDIREMRKLYAAGRSQKEIGDLYGISQRTVSKITLRQRWAWVD